MAKAKIFYLLSEAGRKDSILKGGNGKELQIIEAEITPEIVMLSNVKPDGEVWLPVGCGINYKGEIDIYKYPVTRYYVSDIGEPHLKEERKATYFDSIQTVDQLIAWKKNRLASLERSKQQAEEELKIALEEYRLNKEKEAQEKAEHSAKEAEEKQKREAEKAKREQEKADWIRKHGSQYLKDCLELGVKANLEYVVERAALEFPGYTVDYANNAQWDEKFSPSPEALAELKGFADLTLKLKLFGLHGLQKSGMARMITTMMRTRLICVRQ